MRTAFFVLLLVALGCNGPAPGVTELSQERFLSDLPEGALILDVRTPEEFSSGHVPDAVNIPYDTLASRLPELESDRGRPVIVYCESGRRAGKATSVLLGAGYESVFHLAGDMSEWRANGRPTTRP